MMGGMMGGWGGWGGWMILWWILAVAVVALAVVGIVAFVRSTDRRPATTWQRETAVDILRRRYAAGEIDEEEFQRRSAGLS